MNDTAHAATINTAQRPVLPRFLWGEGLACGTNTAISDLYLLHTETPRFVCRITEASDVQLATGRCAQRQAGWTEDGTFWWCWDFSVSDWQYFDPAPGRDQLHEILLAAASDYRCFQSANEAALQAYTELEGARTSLN